MPSNSYSTGSSTVEIFSCFLSIACNDAYSVVVLPQPVGPVTRIIPFGVVISFCHASSTSLRNPNSPRPTRMFLSSSKRMTIFSPFGVGTVETRRSNGRPRIVARILPSCGSLRSAISRFARIFIRLTTAGCNCFGASVKSCNTPSIRYRTRELLPHGS